MRPQKPNAYQHASRQKCTIEHKSSSHREKQKPEGRRFVKCTTSSSRHLKCYGKHLRTLKVISEATSAVTRHTKIKMCCYNICSLVLFGWSALRTRKQVTECKCESRKHESNYVRTTINIFFQHRSYLCREAVPAPHTGWQP